MYAFVRGDIVPLVADVAAVFTHEESLHILQITTPAMGAFVDMDADSIRQVLTNLVSNAIKYSPQGGNVTIGVRDKEAEVVIWVTDQGMGIPPEVIPKLFGKFFRANNKETRSINGIGLGLALVKALIDAHGGRVWVESEIGVGSTFFFTLPHAATLEDFSAPVPPVQDVALL